MKLNAYLDRLAHGGPLEPTAETLRLLQRAHLTAVPFENLDIHLGNPILLGEAALQSKIIDRRRGGFCYELNGLFAALLRRLGFRVDVLSARVRNANGEYGPEFDHLTLMVTLDRRWLVDVGFGDSFLEPLLLDERDEQVVGGIGYRIDEKADHLLLLQQSPGGDWEPQYRFTLQRRRLGDFEPMCHYHQSSPESIFTRKRVCTRALPDGRVTLSEMNLITTRGGNREETPLRTQEEYLSALHEEFGVRLSREDVDRIVMSMSRAAIQGD